MIRSRMAAFAAFAGLLSCLTARAESYHYTLIAQSGSGSGFTDFNGFGINDAGTVAFGAELGSRSGVYAGSGGPLTTIADTTGGQFVAVAAPVINSAGTVAFLGGLNGVYAGRGGPITTIADTSGAFGPFSLFNSPLSINDSGTVAFLAFTSRGQGIFAGNGVGVTTVAAPEQFLGVNYPSINNAGSVAFQGYPGVGNEGIFMGDGRTITAVVTRGGQFNFVTEPSLNNRGDVAFQADLDAMIIPNRGIFVARDGSISTIATTINSPFSDVRWPALNDVGAVAFQADFRSGGGSGLFFADPDGMVREVIRTGEALFGSTVVDLDGFSDGTLNNAGQIAFRARLADGREVVARADPLLVPEPGTFTLLASGLLILCGVASRKSRGRVIGRDQFEAEAIRGKG